MKRSTDYYLASACVLFVASAGATLWLYLRYQQAATAFEASLKKIRLEQGKIVVGSAQSQSAAAESLRMFLVAGILTLICAIILVAIVFWRRKQRLQAVPSEEFTK